MGYQWYDPTIWILFAAFVVVVVGARRIFARKYPDYPGRGK